jgi:diguanylate cyclase (GGDEF)-like protein
MSVRLAGQCSPPLSSYQPVLNQFWTECARLIDERFRTGTLGSDGMGRLDRLAAECQRLQGSQPAPLDSRVPALGGTIGALLEAIRLTWHGAYSDAQDHLDLARRLHTAALSWIDAAIFWAAGELAWAKRVWPEAESAFSQMKSIALAVEHERFASIAQELLAQVYEGQGKHVQARAELRELNVRERKIGRDSLASRELVVQWRLGARRSELHLAQALAESRQFERWSLEDALTGIANRRSFELTLAQRLGDSGCASGMRKLLAVAMVDVDKFKSINDTYSHLVGDRVLKTLASLMSACIRDRDVAARWAGDEFVILFDGAGIEAAAQVCNRIHEAIEEFDWQAIAPGLHVTVSIGLSEVTPGDSIESVLSRSDESMYSTKTLDDLPPIARAIAS